MPDTKTCVSISAYVSCGSGTALRSEAGGKCKNNESVLVNASTEENKFGVRCIRDTKKRNWKKGTCGKWSASKKVSEIGCAKKTYTEALESCAAAGGRLPTKDEVEEGCVEGDGCGFNSKKIWTATGSDGSSIFNKNLKIDLTENLVEIQSDLLLEQQQAKTETTSGEETTKNGVFISSAHSSFSIANASSSVLVGAIMLFSIHLLF
jgi:hypothetical protein